MESRNKFALSKEKIASITLKTIDAIGYNKNTLLKKKVIVILPNVNAIPDKTLVSVDETEIENGSDNITILDEQEERILEYIKNYNKITKNEVAGLLGVSASTALRLLRGLLKENILVKKGKARNTYYTASKS